MDLIRIFQKITNRAGISIRPYKASTHPDKRLSQTLKHFKIDAILDIGANTGQFAVKLLDNGFKGLIFSFEPLSSCHDVLISKSKKYNNWKIYEKGALGSENTETFINVSENSVSSSLLDIKETHLQGEPSSRYISKEKIVVRRLDDIFDKLSIHNKNIFLKIDVQGFEMEVLKGAETTINQATLVSVELSLVPVYENGDMLYKDVINYFEERGFYLYGFQTAFVDNQTGQVLQADGIFAKSVIS
ncbi:MAG: hypothetical protein RLZZ546_2260 [Bacteroidota bacterium]